tara:strand:- start:22841 stop:24223 length:1383 start_codon:yes stop_codon:yes gene_type:complete
MVALGWARFDFRQIKDGVVRIVVLSEEAETTGKGMISLGSGFVISSQGHIVTNQHMIDKPGRILAVQLRDNKVKVWRVGAVVYESREKDLAVLLVPELGGLPIRLAKNDPYPGDEVITIGFPGMADAQQEKDFFVNALLESGFRDLPLKDGYVNFVRPSVIRGNVEDVRIQSNWGRDNNARCTIIRHNAPTASGNSGGALVNDSNEIVGVHTASDAEARDDKTKASQGKKVGLGLAVSELIEVLESVGIPYNEIPAKTTGEVEPGNSRSETSTAEEAAPTWAKALPFVMIGLAVVLVIPALKLLLGDRTSTKTARRKPHQRIAGEFPSAPASEKGATVGNQRSNHQSNGRLLGSLSGTDEQGKRYFFQLSASDFQGRGDSLKVGRTGNHVEIAIPHPSISRVHASLRYSPDNNEIALRDENSANGCRINGKKLTAKDGFQPIGGGDCLQLGTVKLVYQPE